MTPQLPHLAREVKLKETEFCLDAAQPDTVGGRVQVFACHLDTTWQCCRNADRCRNAVSRQPWFRGGFGSSSHCRIRARTVKGKSLVEYMF